MNKINYSNLTDKINKFLKVFVIPLLVANIFLYLIGSFIALDFDFNNWWAFRSTIGRFFISLFEMMILLNITKWYSQYDSK